jgi:hypothetical protein
MTPQYLNELKIHMLYVNESPELADLKTQEYIDKFNKLDKYDIMEVYHNWGIDGFEKSLELVDKYANIG